MNIHEVNDLLSEALQADLEHGVKWLNEEAGRRFTQDYPYLHEALVKIADAEYPEKA